MRNTVQSLLAAGLSIGALALMMNMTGFAGDTYAPTLPGPVQPYMSNGSGQRIDAQAMPMAHNPVTIYLYNPDYPITPILKSPKPPVQETSFWRYMDQEMQATNYLNLTENLEEADYRVEIKCAGVLTCGKLKVFIESPNRDVLSSFTLGHTSSLMGSPQGTLQSVAQRLTQRVNEKIRMLDDGHYGYTR